MNKITQSVRKSCLLFLSGFSFLFLSSLAEAKPVIYDFTVRVTEGTLQGNRFQGFLIYDDEVLTGVGQEKIGVEQGLKVCMTFFQQTYDETQDSNYPEFPQLMLNDGQIERLDFWIEKGNRVQWWNREGWEVQTTQREVIEAIPPCLSPSSDRQSSLGFAEKVFG